MRRVFITSVIALLLSLGLNGQEITVSSAPDTSVILIGDQTGFTVTASLPSGVRAELSGAADTLAGKIVILRRSPRDTAVMSDNRIQITDRYLVTSFDSGSYTIPPFYAEIAEGDSLVRFYSDYSFMKVLRPDVTPPDSTDVIFDIVPPRGAPVAFTEILPWIIIVLIAAVIIYLLARYLPRNPLRRFVRPPVPPEPAHVIALRDLQALMATELWQKGEIKEYYSRLSDILRRYLENRYGISSPELTTDETIRMLNRAAVTTSGQMALVKEVLSVSDMVKFAKYIPDSALHQVMYDNSLAFVEATKAPEMTAAEGEEKVAGKAGHAEGANAGVKGGEHE
ncbi:MAG: hypothetical protein GX622_13155 [Bacteroidales bacterium]|nr:hypothetical protein [Bacteroidales bacterium]